MIKVWWIWVASVFKKKGLVFLLKGFHVDIYVKEDTDDVHINSKSVAGFG